MPCTLCHSDMLQLGRGTLESLLCPLFDMLEQAISWNCQAWPCRKEGKGKERVEGEMQGMHGAASHGYVSFHVGGGIPRLSSHSLFLQWISTPLPQKHSCYCQLAAVCTTRVFWDFWLRCWSLYRSECPVPAVNDSTSVMDKISLGPNRNGNCV